MQVSVRVAMRRSFLHTTQCTCRQFFCVHHFDRHDCERTKDTNNYRETFVLIGNYFGKDYSTYEVGSKGHIRRIGARDHVALSKVAFGYTRVGLTTNNQKTQESVHIIMAILFKSAEYTADRCFVDHINGCHWDNRVSSLRWVTPKENAIFANGRPVSVQHKDTGAFELFDSINNLSGL